MPVSSTPASSISLHSTFVSAPTLTLPAADHPAVGLWKGQTQTQNQQQRSLRTDIQELLDQRNVQFALLGLFGVIGLCSIDGDDRRPTTTVVVAVRPGSLSVDSARDVIAQICLVLQRYAFLFSSSHPPPFAHGETMTMVLTW